METEVALVGLEEHVCLFGELDVFELQRTLVRRLQNEALPVRDIVVDFRQADGLIEAGELATFAELLQRDAGVALSQRTVTLVCRPGQLEDDTDTVAHPRIDLVVDDSQ